MIINLWTHNVSFATSFSTERSTSSWFMTQAVLYRGWLETERQGGTTFDLRMADLYIYIYIRTLISCLIGAFSEITMLILPIRKVSTLFLPINEQFFSSSPLLAIFAFTSNVLFFFYHFVSSSMIRFLLLFFFPMHCC